jgi:hypothetical protein
MRRGNNGRAWNIALGYIIGPYKATVSYQETRRKFDAGSFEGGKKTLKNQVVSGTFDVIPHQGLKFYGEVTYIRARGSEGARNVARAILDAADRDNVQVAKRNKGTVFILGTKVSF